MFSEHNGMIPEINHKKNTEKHTKTCRLNNVLLNNHWVKNKIKVKIKIYFQRNKNENTITQNLWEQS